VKSCVLLKYVILILRVACFIKKLRYYVIRSSRAEYRAAPEREVAYTSKERAPSFLLSFID